MSDHNKTERYVQNEETTHITAPSNNGGSDNADYPDFILFGKPDEDGLISLFDAEEFPAAIGQYKIIEPIGRGGMGTIFKAEHIHLKREVAIKVISDKHLNDESIEKWFQFETLVMGKLQHPNIVQTTDAGVDRGRRYLVMELLKGNDLSEYVKENGSLDLEDALTFLRQAAIALEFSHLHQIVHRDVKPSNIFLTEDGQIKLLDLGLAQCICEEVEHQPVNGIVGSPCFMAPEQISGKAVDARSDLYSLGCTFYYMLTGKFPFAGPKYKNVHSVFRAHLYENLPKIGYSRFGIPKSVELLLERMTAKRPEDRFQTMSELVDAIDDIALIEPAVSLKFARQKRVRTMTILSAVVTPIVIFLCVHLSQTHGTSPQVHSIKIDTDSVGMTDSVEGSMTDLISSDMTIPKKSDIAAPEKVDDSLTCPPELHAVCVKLNPDGKGRVADPGQGICPCPYPYTHEKHM